MKLYWLDFSIRYNTPKGLRISNFLREADLGIENLIPSPSTFRITTKTKVDTKYANKVFSALKSKLEKAGFVVYDVKLIATGAIEERGYNR